jgi:hypothetical protein
MCSFWLGLVKSWCDVRFALYSLWDSTSVLICDCVCSTCMSIVIFSTNPIFDWVGLG